MDNIQDILPKLRKCKPNSNGWIACCPAHADRKPSLSIKVADNGRILYKCHAGCSYVHIVQALGINEHEQNNFITKEDDKRKMIIAEYDYTDENGEILYQAVKLEPKSFRVRRPNPNGGWFWDIKGTRRVPYHLPELLEARAKGLPVILCEGEKDVENIEEKLNFVATTTALGSESWSNEYAEFFEGLDVIILPDNDAAGRKYAEDAAASLAGTAKALKVVSLPNLGEKGDVSDCIEQGGNKEQLEDLIVQTPEWKKEDNQETKERTSSSLFIIKPANEWITEASNKPIPKMLFGEFWYEGEICILYADTNLGKSSLAVQIADSITKGKAINPFALEAEAQNVLYFDFELSDRQFISRYSTNRLGMYQNMYQFDEKLLRVEINPDGIAADSFAKYEEALTASIEKAIVETGTKILIIDNITYLKSDNEHAKDALPLMQALKTLKTKHDLSILVLGHTTKIHGPRPITKNDLAGSKMLVNFCDSAFSMGKSQLGSTYRYLIQMKQRNTAVIYDSSNVCYGQITKPDNFLMFNYEGRCAESEHIEMIKNNREQEMKQVKELRSMGYSQRKIADTMDIALGKVNQLVNEVNPNDFELDGGKAESSFYATDKMDEIDNMDGLKS